MAKGDPEVFTITEAQRALSDEQTGRTRRYLVSMGIRTACWTVFCAGAPIRMSRSWAGIWKRRSVTHRAQPGSQGWITCLFMMVFPLIPGST